ncbi:MAG: ribosome maturation factor RimM [Desulfovibrio sp.]|nr:ribosome maturation factor RimM [Desulfovibrio sp.]
MAINYIHMGSITRPHGISGEIVLEWFAISPFVLQYPFFLQKGSEAPEPVTIESVRRHNGRLLIRLKDVQTRDQAERFRGCKLLTARSALPAPKENEAYIADLLGADVFLEDGTRLGRFHDTVRGALPTWIIRTDRGEEILFPQEQQFIVSLDAEAGRIVIAPPPGLIELYLTPEESKN